MKPAREPMTRMQRVMEEAVFAKRKLTSIFVKKTNVARIAEVKPRAYIEFLVVVFRVYVIPP